MSTRLNIALIYGSDRRGRFCDTVAAWARAHLETADDIALDVIDPLALSLPPHHERGSETIEAFRRRIGGADGFIVITPEYNHGYPAALKYLIDSASREWQAKPAAFISYGGISGGLRAIEQLRQVFCELHVVPLRDSVSFANAWKQFDPDGVLLDPEGPNEALAVMLARLRWWAAALRDARGAIPYGQAPA